MKVESIHLRSVFPFLGENDRDPVLTVYLPDNLTQMGRGDQLRPGLLVIPGGGYAMVSEREAEPIALNFLSEGYNVFVLTYSVAPNRFPVQLREVAAALEVIWYSASDWHVDVSKIAIMGFSAGGHLACHYSNCYQIPEVREYFPDSKGVQAAVLCYSVITADPEYSHKGSFKNLTGHDPLTEEDIEQFSLNNLVTSTTPPTFLWHTRTDAAVPVMNTLLYSEALARNGIDFSVHIYPVGKHGLATVDMVTNDALNPGEELSAEWIDTAKKWLKITL